MKITLESTTKIITVNGVQCRVWEGHTESGIPVHAFIPWLAVDKDEDQTQFQAELQEHKAPSPEIEAYPLRLIL